MNLERWILKLLKPWIEAIIDEKIEQAFGRDSLTESVRVRKIEEQIFAEDDN